MDKPRSMVVLAWCTKKTCPGLLFDFPEYFFNKRLILIFLNESALPVIKQVQCFNGCYAVDVKVFEGFQQRIVFGE